MNKQELKDKWEEKLQVRKAMATPLSLYTNGSIDAIELFLQDIEQLKELETLSQEITEEAETVVSVLNDFYKALERAKKVLSMEVDADG